MEKTVKVSTIKRQAIFRILALPKKLGLSSNEEAYKYVSNASGGKVSRHSLQKLCGGRTNPGEKHLDEITDALDLIDDELAA